MTYNEFIDNIINTRGQWNIPENEYFEIHHIIPACVGGDGIRYAGNRKKNSIHENLIWLYPEEHFIAHKLLAEENPDNAKIVFAWSRMTFPKGKTQRNFEISEDDYAELKRMLSKHLSENNPGLKDGHPWNYGLKGVQKVSEETRKKMSEQRKGRKLSEETKQKMRESLKLRDYTNLIGPNKNKIAVSDSFDNMKFVDKDYVLQDNEYFGNCKTLGKHNMSKYYSNVEQQNHRKEISSGDKNPMYGKGYLLIGENNGMYGKHHFEETKKKISQTLTGRTYSNEVNKSKGRPGVKKPDGFSNTCRKLQSRYKYLCDGQIFYGDNEIIEYVKNIYGYNISSMGLNSVIENKPRGCSLYPKIIGKIIREVNEYACKKR